MPETYSWMAAEATVDPTWEEIEDLARTLPDPQATLVPAPADPTEAPPTEGRYVLLEALGEGTTSEVVRGYDRVLQRTVALKILKPDLSTKRALVGRLVREARATAQLDHPGIAPIHELGRLADGRWFYVMKEVSGATLQERVRGQQSSRRRLLEVVLRACETVGFAHAHGWIHRDLKPDNIMVGEHGEVLVVDWGLAKKIGEASVTLVPDDSLVPTDAVATRVGSVLGSPAYMPPEQARGESADARSDVFALGATLYEVLVGHHPAHGQDWRAYLQTLAGGRVPRVPEAARVSADLMDLVHRALASDPEERFATASELAEALVRVLDGVDRKASADRLVTRAEEEGGTHLLHEALQQDPDHVGAHQALAHLYRARAEAPGLPPDQAADLEALVALHDRGDLRDWLRNEATVDLEVEGPPLEVVATPLVLAADGRYLPGAPVPLGTTPIRGARLPAGSWWLDVGGQRLHVALKRTEHWTPRDAGGAPRRIRAAPPTAADECWVPPGWSWVGGDPMAFNALPRQAVWLPGFVMQTFPVTNRAYIAFLDDLVAQGRRAEAERHAPRERGGTVDDLGPIVYGRTDDGGFVLATDVDGDTWQPDWPVVLIDFHAAQAYAAWWSERTGQRWRLPTEREWERAARGADERHYPWGNTLDPRFANLWTSTPGRTLPADVDSFPADVSPYGVRGLGGNVRDWCADPWHDPDVPPMTEPAPADAPRVFRGGCWWFVPELARCCAREPFEPSFRIGYLGFRLVREP